MGAIHFSIDQKLIETLKKAIDFEVFVETGTFKGDTVDLVKNKFTQVFSVELSNFYYQAAKERFEKSLNVFLYNGDSPSFLKELHDQLNNQSVIYWLDAHWCCDSFTAGQTSQCPLINELKAIKKLNDKSVIIIDDARLFLCTPPEPHEVSDWPNFDEIIKNLYVLSDCHQITVVNDCILFFPKNIDSVVMDFSKKYGVDWYEIYSQSLKYGVLDNNKTMDIDMKEYIVAKVQKMIKIFLSKIDVPFLSSIFKKN